MDLLVVVGGIAAVGFLGLLLLTFLIFRRIVPTNEVHIVQSAKSTTSYGKDTGNGNSYYEWPAWIPLIGITKVVLPMSVFDLDLLAYDAYDKGRLPFVVDVKAFFRITDSNVAAQRVASFKELHDQLKAIVQGAIRTILASNEIEEILQGRSTFGEQFTKEVDSQLSQWGVATVKNIELMDIRDSKESHVIRNIMEKKKSFIEMESRVEVANNKKSAEVAEAESRREVELKNTEVEKIVGMKRVEANRDVELANQESSQQIKVSQKQTMEKEMEVKRVELIRSADIQKEVGIVKANQQKETQLIEAETSKQMVLLSAEAELEATKKKAQGYEAEGLSKAAAEKAIQLAPVEAQIVLAKEIGGNKEYQTYLITLEKVKAQRDVGIEQAKALVSAEIKVIANSGNTSSGLNSVMDVFSSQGGTQIGAMLEGLANTEAGSKLINKIMPEDKKV